MTEQLNKNKTLVPVILIAAAIIVVAALTNLKNQSPSNYVNESGNIIISGDSAFAKWFGKQAPDFSVTDINGKKHSLGDYRGKNVMVIFWATWCPPCRAEIPHLIKLRNQESEESLAILAISNEDEIKIRDFVKGNKINYTVAALGDNTLPSPFIDVESIPTCFFINPDGLIKTVVVQSLNLEQIKAILEAKTSINENGSAQQNTSN